MTREEARKVAEVMMAYADGKEIDFLNSKDEWKISQSPAFDWEHFDYRIKKEPTYRPFKNKEECWNEMQKHQPFGWIQNKKGKEYVNVDVVGGDPCDCGVDGIEYCEMFNGFTFADGTPFGIKEDE